MATESTTPPIGETKQRKRFQFPSAVTTLAIVTVVVWLAALIIPAGQYKTQPDGSPIPGTYHQVPSPLSFGEMVQQLVLRRSTASTDC